jgi:hypothetical protein
LFDDLAELVDGTQATGANAYRGGDPTSVIAPYAPSSDEDEFGATQTTFVSRYGAKHTQSYIQGSSATTEPTQQSSNKGKQHDAGDAIETQLESDNENIDPVRDLFIQFTRSTLTGTRPRTWIWTLMSALKMWCISAPKALLAA